MLRKAPWPGPKLWPKAIERNEIISSTNISKQENKFEKFTKSLNKTKK